MWSDEREVVEFLERVMDKVSKAGIQGGSVVEMGSAVMHDHDARPLFAGPRFTRYVGVDHRPGLGVDLVALAHEDIVQEEVQDAVVALSISALEHDPHWDSTIAAMVGCAHPEHALICLTAPGDPWGAHELECAPIVAGEPYYGNIEMGAVLRCVTSQVAAREMAVLSVDAWFNYRQFSPHWPRVNVIVEIGSHARAQRFPAG